MERIGFRIPLILSIALFIGSLFLPVYYDPAIPGYMALLGGWMTLLNDIPTAISWLANVTFIIAVVKILKRKEPKPFAALIFSVLSLCLGLAVLGAGMAFGGASKTMAKSAMGMGFYVWIMSFILLIIASWIKFKKR